MFIINRCFNNIWLESQMIHVALFSFQRTTLSKDITHLDWGVIMEKCPGLIADTYTKVMEILTEREVLEL